MLLLVRIDLANADVALFEDYERQVLALLGAHGARVEERLRAADNASETHLLYFSDEAAYESFREDPVRAASQTRWAECRATAQVERVERIG